MILIIGAGVAGLSAARAACVAGSDVTLVTAGSLALGEATSTAMAQGGVAAAMAANDSPAAHLRDTIAAGAGLVDAEAADVLTRDGAAIMRRVIAEGFAVDRDAAGAPALGLEAAHGAHRIVHAGGDRTGARLYAHLVASLPERVRVLEHTQLVDLVVEHGEVVGARLTRAVDGTGTGADAVQSFITEVRADAVLLATGGYAALYARTSNHAGARGAGIVAAAAAGALVADLEFVQFHPTVLAGTGQLISEAVRGAGAVLRDGAGHRYMADRHPGAELAPRDVVSRETHRVLHDRGEAEVWLDARQIEVDRGAGSLAKLFPGITEMLRARGYDWTREAVPVTPAAHYTMGGVASDLDGRSSLPGLFVAGEVAATGVHGANRLASNSLLEGLVFGDRAGRAATAYTRASRGSKDWTFTGQAMAQLLRTSTLTNLEAAAAPGALRRAASPMVSAVGAGLLVTGGAGLLGAGPLGSGAVSAEMTSHLGIERDRAGMSAAQDSFAALAGGDAVLAGLITVAALAREESRGAHQRSDYSVTDPTREYRRGFALAAAAPVQAASIQTVSAHAASAHASSGGIASVRAVPAVVPALSAPAEQILTATTDSHWSLASC